ncbi:MAG: hypothetical protein FWD79_08915 [Desulfobulbus sp.]|nr:hypothetical protein [Desulfobulbus sp.]
MAVFQKNIMADSLFTKDAMMGTTAEDIKSRIVRNSGTIGFPPISQADYLVHSPNAPEISRPITLIVKGEPSEDMQRVLDYINKDGQRYIIK